MPRLTFRIGVDGLHLDVIVGPDRNAMLRMVAVGQPIPKPSRARGEIDTGTNVTCVSLPILQGLGAPVKQQGKTLGISGPLTSNLYEVSVSLTDFATPGAPLFVQPRLLVMELPVALPKVDVLIGMDVLLGCRLLVDGPARQFTLDF
jgi:hypothetical protein